jgi:diketogulonate reductase-like aldo/keto reductase
MELRPLGRTGVSVSKLCLGAMMFGEWGTSDHEESIRIIHRALDAGINFIDTADVYSAGESEEIVGKARHNVRFHDKGTKRVHHPVVGELTLSFETMELTADPGLTIAVYTAEPGSKS